MVGEGEVVVIIEFFHANFYQHNNPTPEYITWAPQSYSCEVFIFPCLVGYHYGGNHKRGSALSYCFEGLKENDQIDHLAGDATMH